MSPTPRPGLHPRTPAEHRTRDHHVRSPHFPRYRPTTVPSSAPALPPLPPRRPPPGRRSRSSGSSRATSTPTRAPPGGGYHGGTGVDPAITGEPPEERDPRRGAGLTARGRSSLDPDGWARHSLRRAVGDRPWCPTPSGTRGHGAGKRGGTAASPPQVGSRPRRRARPTRTTRADTPPTATSPEPSRPWPIRCTAHPRPPPTRTPEPRSASPPPGPARDRARGPRLLGGGRHVPCLG